MALLLPINKIKQSDGSSRRVCMCVGTMGHRACLLISMFLACSARGAGVEGGQWWKSATLYQVYPRSFRDSDGDGVGDLKGITEKAAYLRELGVDAVWLSPIFRSPMVDFGYDISDFCDIDPVFGSLADFDQMVAEMKVNGLRVLVDFVPNHSSDQHPWFQWSLNESHALHSAYRDFYVWRDPIGYDRDNKPLPPNNWASVFGGSMWEYREERRQFYLHQFAIQQPDFNLTNPLVFGNLTAVLDFWMDRGVDGFRVDAAKHLYEDGRFPSAPAVAGTAGDTYNEQQHIYTEDLPETARILARWAQHLHDREAQDGVSRLMVLECYSMNIMDTFNYYGRDNTSFEMPFGFWLMVTDQSSPATFYKLIVDFWTSQVPAGDTTVWIIGNHDLKRVADRQGSEMVDSTLMLLGVLPGVRVNYYGDELGMRDTYVRWDQTVDPWARLAGPAKYYQVTRDTQRTPMQWDDTVSAGFSSNKSTWLPVNPNYWWLNVANQKKDPTSHLNVFKAISTAKKDPVLKYGGLSLLAPDNYTLVVLRNYSESYMALVINLDSELKSWPLDRLGLASSDWTVQLASGGAGLATGMHLLNGSHEGSRGLTLRPKGAVLLRSGITPGPAPSSSSAIFGSITLTLFISLLLTNKKIS